MRLLVCGGRDFADVALLDATLDAIHAGPFGPVAVLIHGAARGADTLAHAWAVKRCVNVAGFPADWKRYGKAAGAIRNAEMLIYAKPDRVVAFPGGAGTADMIGKAFRARVPVDVIEPRPVPQSLGVAEKPQAAGGKARAAALTAEQRRAIASAAAKARWKSKP